MKTPPLRLATILLILACYPPLWAAEPEVIQEQPPSSVPVQEVSQPEGAESAAGPPPHTTSRPGTLVGFSAQHRWVEETVLKHNRVCHQEFPDTRVCRVEEVQVLTPPPVFPDPSVLVTVDETDYRYPGGRKPYCVSALGDPQGYCPGARPIACCAAPPSPPPVRFLGYIDEDHEPADGLFALNLACFDRFPGSHLCHIRELQESIPTPPYLYRRPILITLLDKKGYRVRCLGGHGELISSCGGDPGPYVLTCCGK